MKRIIDFTYSKIFNKKFLTFFLAIFVYAIFHVAIELTLGHTIVDLLFSKVSSTPLNDLLFVTVLLGSIIFLIKKFRDYTPSIGFLYFLCYLSIVYLFYRFSNQRWSFTSFYYLPYLKYFDLLIGFLVIDLILFIPKKTIQYRNTKESLIDDKPLTSVKDDALGFSNYADIVASKIQASSFEKSYGIGINGKWGAGKTSFINLLKNKLKNENIIEIEFNPWNSHTPQAIVKDFFGTVQNKIKPYNSTIAKLLIDYSNKLVSLNSNTITQSIQISTTAILGVDSLKNLFDDINQSLRKINKKIIIYIDDLDRLDQSEIIEVIRLIRNTANFYNTFFLVAYDRNYILNALKNYNPYNHEEFLEKIFQIEINLPYFKKEILRITLLEKLKFALPKEYHEKLQTIIGGTQPFNWDNWLETMRDITRLSNSIILNSVNLLGEIDLNDFIKIELLRLKYPSVYKLLVSQTDKFLKPASTTRNQSNYQLTIVKDIYPDNKDSNQHEKYLRAYLTKNHDDLSVPEENIDKIVKLLDDLFPSNQYSHYFNKSKLSIAYPNKFNRYFAYTLLPGSLSELEFKSARLLSQEGFNEKIEEWLKEGLRLEVIFRFVEIREYESKEDFEKVINAIFFLAKNTIDGKINPYFINYDSKDLIEKLGNYRGIIVNDFYKADGGKNGLIAFINSLLNKAQYPYIFESNFVRSVNRELFDENSFPLTKKELEEISIRYLEDYCNQTNQIDGNSFTMFWNCQQTVWVSAGGNAYTKNEEVPEGAKEIFRKFVLKDFNNYLKKIIDIEPVNGQKFCISRSVVTLFNGFENFKKTLFTEDEAKWNYIYEFRQFFEAYEKTDFNQYVDFDFKIIPVESSVQYT